MHPLGRLLQDPGLLLQEGLLQGTHSVLQVKKDREGSSWGRSGPSMGFPQQAPGVERKMPLLQEGLRYG
jgi:hypothetical protein